MADDSRFSPHPELCNMVWQRQMAERDELSSKSATGARLRDRQKGRPRGGGERSEFAASETMAEGVGFE